MFIKQRRVRRGKFASRFVSSSLQRREYTASLYTTGIIQFLLFWALVYGVFKTAVMMNAQFPESGWQVRYSLSFVMAVIAVLVLASFIRNLRMAIEMYKRPTSSDAGKTAEPRQNDAP